MQHSRRHLPRLPREFYAGAAFVHWVLTTERRSTGWLGQKFHADWDRVLVHTCARYTLLCPVYVLMPDHVHLIWLGLDQDGSDQLMGIEHLKKHLSGALAPSTWQRQAFDHVLTESERAHDAFQRAAWYVLENPVRAGLVLQWREYAYVGCCLPGYPEFDVRMEDYWERFWRCYNFLSERTTRWRSQPPSE